MLGVQPFFVVANHVPGFSQAHNTRLAIVTLLCLALLAGLGARHASRPRAALLLVVAIAVAAGASPGSHARARIRSVTR